MPPQTPTRTPPSKTPPPAIDPGFALEQRLGDLQGHLEQLKTQVRQAQQLAGLGTVAATMAHEVNNLLTPIFNYAKAALEADDEGLRRKALEVTKNNAGMLVAMAGRVLEISAAAAPTRESVSVEGVVQDAVASLCRDLSKDSIRFVLDVEDGLAVWADRMQIQQVLFNLLLNAREALADSGGGKIGVTANRRDNHVLVEVHNSGKAIPPDLLSHIFEPLQTSKQTGDDDTRRCSGLGLALCRDLVDENGGTISVASDPEAGTTFSILLGPPPMPSS